MTFTEIVFNKFSATTNQRWIHCVALEATAIPPFPKVTKNQKWDERNICCRIQRCISWGATEIVFNKFSATTNHRWIHCVNFRSNRYVYRRSSAAMLTAFLGFWSNIFLPFVLRLVCCYFSTQKRIVWSKFYMIPRIWRSDV